MKKIFILSFILAALFPAAGYSQLEWQLTAPVFNPADPDGGGPATGSVTFKVQIRATTVPVLNIANITTGYAYQSANAMVPTGVACGTNSIPQPSNITMLGIFASGGFTYNNVNQCSGAPNFTAGGQMFNRRSAGTLDGGLLTIPTTYTDMFSVTLWTLQSTNPQGGYAVINSGSSAVLPPAGSVFNTYAVADDNGIEYGVTSATYTAPLPLGTGVVPVSFGGVDIACSGGGTKLSWNTLSEINTSSFDIESSTNGNAGFVKIASVAAAGQSSTARSYSYDDNKRVSNFYRIKVINNDGSFTYSDVKKSPCASSEFVYSVYPVPAREVLNIRVSAGENVKATFQLFDASGRIVNTSNQTLVAGFNTVTMDVRRLPAGTYILRNTADAKLSRTIVKQ